MINATGVVLHTNLGRAPLAEAALERVHAVAAAIRTSSTTSTPASAARGRITSRALVCELTGAEAAICVNNNAAALVLALAALAGGREVLVSRGQLVEIGGGFRIPEILQAPAHVCTRSAPPTAPALPTTSARSAARRARS